MNGNDTFLDVNNAHLRVTSGNVYASAFNLDQIDIVMSSNTASTVNFNNPVKAFNTVSNIEVGTANLFVDTTTTRVGIGTNAPAYTLDVHGSANVGVITTTDINVTGNLAVLGTSTIVDTDNLRVKDPIIELGKDNTASPVVDLGLVMTRPSGSSNVGIIFDESTDTLEIGYTQGNASDSTITMDSTPLSVNVNGDLSVTSNVAVDTDTLFVDSVNDRVGIGTTNPKTPLEVSQSSGFFKSMYIQKYLGTGPELATSYVLLLKSESSNPKRLVGNISGVRGYSGFNNTFEAEIIAGVGSGAQLSGRMTFNYAGNSNNFYAKLVSLTYNSSTYIALALIPTANYNGMSGGIYFNGNTGAIDELQYITDLGTVSNVVDFPISGGDKTTFTGNVGIGTTSPAKKLHVEHYGSAIGDFEGIRIANHATNLHATSRPAYEFVVSDIDAGTGIGASKFAIGYRDTTSASRTDRLVIDASGNVGIGDTNPGHKFVVKSGSLDEITTFKIETQGSITIARNHNSSPFISSNMSSGHPKWNLGNVTTTRTSINGGSNQNSYFNTGGGVGIGTDNPGRTLDVEGSFQVAPGNGTSFETNGQKVSSPNDNTNSGTTNHFATMSVTLSRYTTQTSRPIYFGSGDDSDTTFVIGTTGGLGGAGFTNTNLKVTGASYLYVKRVYANGSQLSDDRLKINEEPIKNATKTILKLKPLVYDKYEKLGELTSNVFEVESGLMVQDVWYDTPELRHIVDVPDDAKPTETKEEDPEYTSWGSKPAYLTYTQLLPYIIKSIQEIHNEKGKLKLDYYGSGIDIDTHRGMIICNHPTVHLCNNERDPTCVGVLSDIDNSEVLLETHGVGNVWIINTNGNLNAGDYITTSTVSGYGQKQNSEFLANYTVAKILEPCNFTETTKPVKRAIKRLEDVTYYVIYKKILINEELYNRLPENERHIETYTSLEDEDTTTDYYKLLRTESKHFREGAETITRQELVNVLDEHGQIQWEDDPSGATEKAYKIRYLDANGVITDEANHVYKAAFVGCTYHCG